MSYPELLLPVGDKEMLLAAVHNGADAVYMGVPGWNARGRTEDFNLDELKEMIEYAKLRGLRCYLAMNVLIFQRELEELSPYLYELIKLKPDAFILQDIGLARLIRSIAPNQEIHASTQMTLSSVEALHLIQNIGFSRAVLARELSLEQIQSIQENTSIELEVFVHGALCVSYSGQCLTSEAFGGRSANRGQCAQSCRLPYTLFVDGVQKNTDKGNYLFSPFDLSSIDLIPQLKQIGIQSLKVEGRLKSPEYVAAVTQAYRSQIDESFYSKENQESLEVLFSRGLKQGFLKGVDHQEFINQSFSNHHGEYLGSLEKIENRGVYIHSKASLKAGDGLLFENQHCSLGARLYHIEVSSKDFLHLSFSKEFDLSQLQKGMRVYRNDSPSLEKKLQNSYKNRENEKKIPINISLTAQVNERLQLIFSDGQNTVKVYGDILEKAHKIRENLQKHLIKELAALSGSPYRVEKLDLNVSADIFLLDKTLRSLKQKAVTQLNEIRLQKHLPIVFKEPKEISLLQKNTLKNNNQETSVSVLIRKPEQLEALQGTSIQKVILDLDWGVELSSPFEKAKSMGLKVGIATLRIHQPNENHYLNRILRLKPDFVLIRNLGALYFFKDKGIQLTGDYSLNISNSLSADWFFEQGLHTIHPSWDLNSTQLFELLDASTASNFEIALHQYMPAFHTRHCVFAALLSQAKDFPDCQKVCTKHQVELLDHKGEKHFLKSDAECRNTLFVGKPQSALKLLKGLQEKGTTQFRIELLDENISLATRKINWYQQAISRELSIEEAMVQIGVEEKYGLSEGQLFNKSTWKDKKKCT